jgi:hypothetical protein
MSLSQEELKLNLKVIEFGRLSLLLPIYWYPSDDEEDDEVSLTEFN